MSAVFAATQLIVPLAKSEESTMGTSDSAQNSGSMYLLDIMQEGILSDPELAKGIATLLLRNLYGISEEERQMPLLAVDQGENWLIAASKTIPDASAEHGSFKAILRKRDCAVLYIAIERNIPITPEAKAILDRELGHKP